MSANETNACAVIGEAVCKDCGAKIHAPSGMCGAGYARVGDSYGDVVCYPCADRRERAAMDATPIGGKFVAYMSNDGKRIITWTGGELAAVLRIGKRHPWSRERFYFSAKSADGRTFWKGVGAEGMYCRLTRTRGR